MPRVASSDHQGRPTPSSVVMPSAQVTSSHGLPTPSPATPALTPRPQAAGKQSNALNDTSDNRPRVFDYVKPWGIMKLKDFIGKGEELPRVGLAYHPQRKTYFPVHEDDVSIGLSRDETDSVVVLVD
ncbi:hypothetical protein HK097_008970 [Rhizophlyctis rosea]|uniref:Uncharacterized protein n=1 Tax=Rhizophlyctis rosea TaxID=64517 RepID=A0AAD5SJ97_9FUNG|nr:hypothetical protein HK097_008970 [Rhizophlyctis rosea]